MALISARMRASVELPPGIIAADVEPSYLHSCATRSSAWARPLSDNVSVDLGAAAGFAAAPSGRRPCAWHRPCALLRRRSSPRRRRSACTWRNLMVPISAVASYRLERIADDDRNLVPHVLGRAGRDEDVGRIARAARPARSAEDDGLASAKQTSCRRATPYRRPSRRTGRAASAARPGGPAAPAGAGALLFCGRRWRGFAAGFASLARRALLRGCCGKQPQHRRKRERNRQSMRTNHSSSGLRDHPTPRKS